MEQVDITVYFERPLVYDGVRSLCQYLVFNLGADNHEIGLNFEGTERFGERTFGESSRTLEGVSDVPVRIRGRKLTGCLQRFDPMSMLGFQIESAYLDGDEAVHDDLIYCQLQFNLTPGYDRGTEIEDVTMIPTFRELTDRYFSENQDAVPLNIRGVRDSGAISG